ncbi:hypothetical protein HA466_0123430 [Hirschfeldia incana]|nr:hypothetical protein HA466_0123430 [Hirschfeldia incana]
MACQKAHFENQILDLYNKISNLKSLKPSKIVDILFQQLVSTCLPTETNIDVEKLCPKIQDIRTNIIKLRSEAIGYSEEHFSTVLGSLEDNPLHRLDIYPYYTNYLKLSKVEFDLLMLHTSHVPTKIAFVGSGSLPFTSIILAKFHLPKTTFHNFDIDPRANSLASQLLSRDPDLFSRIIFHTMDILDASEVLRDYEVIFLASLVGVDREAKIKVIEHLEKHMAPGALLMLRSAKGLRAFLYIDVDPCDLRGFEVLETYHPSLSDGFVNSVMVARKLSN